MAEPILYNRIGQDYNLTRMADPTIAAELLRLLAGNANRKYLDIGCGTGNYTRALSDAGLPMHGVDPSIAMLEKARLTNSSIEWKEGVAENIPYTDLEFDGIIGTLTMHHWSNLELGFSELNRVLKPDGKLVLFTSTPEQMKGYWLNHYFPNMLQKSMEQMPSIEALQAAISGTSLSLVHLEKYFVQPDLKDHFMYIGKHHPELYFNNTIRNGISSFANLAHAREVQNGLEQLQIDLNSGNIHRIIANYTNDLGDYLFVCFHKKTDTELPD